MALNLTVSAMRIKKLYLKMRQRVQLRLAAKDEDGNIKNCVAYQMAMERNWVSDKKAIIRKINIK